MIVGLFTSDALLLNTLEEFCPLPLATFLLLDFPRAIIVLGPKDLGEIHGSLSNRDYSTSRPETDRPRMPCLHNSHHAVFLHCLAPFLSSFGYNRQVFSKIPF